MDPIVIPEDLSHPDVDLTGLRSALATHLEALEASETTVEVVEEMERTVAALDLVTGQIDANTALAGRRDAALARKPKIAEPEPEPEAVTEPEAEVADPEAVAEPETPAEPEAVEAQPEVPEPADAPAEPVAETEPETPAEEAPEAADADQTNPDADADQADADQTNEANQATPTEAPTGVEEDHQQDATQEPDVTDPTVDQPEAVAASGARNVATLVAPTGAQPRPSRASGDFMVATANADGLRPGTALDSVADVARAIAETRKNFRNIPQGPAEYLTIATGLKQIDAEVGGDAVENFGVLRDIQSSGEAIVASGAFCTPQTPLYDFFRVAEKQSPVEDKLPVVQAPRGGIRFIPATDDRVLAATGVAITDEADIDPDDSGTWKPCVRIDCPDIEEETVTGVSQCVTFGNLHYRTFAEQVEAFLEDVGVAFASTKETYYLDFIHGASTAVTGVDTGYGAIRDHIYNLALAATQYRKRLGMRRGSTLRIYEPDWLMDLVKVDMAMDAQLGLNFLAVPDSQVNDLYRQWGLDVVWYNDAATGTNQKWAIPQAAGAINPFPGTVQSYLHAPGTFVKLDGGTLDVGLVRDSTLNRTNDIQLFFEEWIGMAQLGPESVRLVDELCANGAAITEGVSAYAC